MIGKNYQINLEALFAGEFQSFNSKIENEEWFMRIIKRINSFHITEKKEWFHYTFCDKGGMGVKGSLQAAILSIIEEGVSNSSRLCIVSNVCENLAQKIISNHRAKGCPGNKCCSPNGKWNLHGQVVRKWDADSSAIVLLNILNQY